MRFGSTQHRRKLNVIVASAAALFAAVASGQSARQTNAPAVPQASTQQSPFGGSIVEDVIARVNDQIVNQSDYNRAEQDLEQRARQANMTPQQIEAERRGLLRDLIDQQLLLSKGKELDINGETELIRELNDLRKQNHLETMEDLQKAAEAQGVNYEDFKANIRNRIITQEVIRQQVGRHLNLTQADVQRYYEAHKSEFSKPESVRLNEILIPTTSAADAPDDAAKSKADALEAKLKSGADFNEVGKNAGSLAPQGGDLGVFHRGQLAKVLEDQTFSLNAGQFTEPIRTRQGYIILKVMEHTPGGVPTLKDVQPQVEDALAQERVQPAVRAYLAEARQEAYIYIRPGYVDTAAVPNQNPILYSAYTPPAPKKKKKVLRTRYRQKTRHETQTAGAVPGALAAPQPAAPSLADVPHAPESAGVQADASSSPAPGSTGTAGGVASDPSASASTASAKVANAPAAPAKTAVTARTRTGKSANVASAGTMKAGKKEKIRFGQAPRETLPVNDNTQNIDAHATPADTTPTDMTPGTAGGDSSSAATAGSPGGQEVASADISDPTAQAAKGDKKRFSDRAKLPKVKKPNGPQADPLAPPPPTAEETATQQVQDTPLGLAGDTMKPAKKKRVKPAEKTRLQDGKKAPATDENQPAGQTPLTSPAQPATPAQTTPGPAPAAPLETNPVQTPPTGTQGVPTPGEGNPAAPPPPPQ